VVIILNQTTTDMKAILILLIIFFSLTSFGQQTEKKDSSNIPVLSLADLRQVTNALQYMPAKDWLKVCQIIEQAYFRKVRDMNKDQPKKDSTSSK